jgi:hypothetical protein
MHANDEALGAPHDDDALAALALVLATALEKRDATLLVVHLAAGEGVLGARNGEARAHDRIEALATQQRRQLHSFFPQDLVSGGGGPGRAIEADDRGVLHVRKKKRAR